MPVFTFEGFATGSPVSVSAQQAGAEASGSVPAWGQPSMAQIEIVEDHSTIKAAPAGIWLRAVPSGFDIAQRTGEYDPAFHDITYVWSIDELDAPGGSVIDSAPITFENPELNLPDVWNNPNTRYGPEIGVGLNDPGVYRFSCYAYDRGGNTGFDSYEVTVADPDTAFPGGQTICWSNSGDFAGAPTNSECVTAAATATNVPPGATVTTSADHGDIFNKLLANRISGGNNLKSRVLFRRGETIDDFTWYGWYDRANEGTAPNVPGMRFGAFGAGERPILRRVSATAPGMFTVQNNGTFAAEELIFHDIDFQGPWDTTTQTGWIENGPISCADNMPDTFMMLHRTGVRGFNGIRLPGGDSFSDNITTIVSDSYTVDCSGWAYSDGGGGTNMRLGLIGVTSAHLPGSLSGIGAQPLALGAPIRLNGSHQKVVYSCCDFFCKGGYSGGAGAQPPYADQGAMRFEGKRADSFFYIDRVAAEGGLRIVKMELLGTVPVGNYVFDKLLAVPTNKTGDIFTLRTPTITVRNMLVCDANPGSTLYQVFAMIRNVGMPDEPFRFYNNTLYSLRSSYIIPFIKEFDVGNGFYSDITEENNVTHQPNAGVDSGPFTAETITGYTPRYAGPLDAFPRIEFTLASELADQGTVSIPYPSGTGLANAWTNQAAMMNNSSKLSYYEVRGDFDVTYGASDITFKNTRGSALAAGTYYMTQSRPSEIPAPDATYANPASLLLMKPETGTEAPTGLTAYDDFVGTVRGTVRERGALEQG